MSTGPESDQSVPMTECRICQTDVPAGELLRAVRLSPDTAARGRPRVAADQ